MPRKPSKKQSAPDAVFQTGKTAHDLAWMLYVEIRDLYPDGFNSAFDHQWQLCKCVEAATLQIKEDTKIKKLALSQMEPNKPRN